MTIARTETPGSIEELNPEAQAVAVVAMLDRARHFLSDAVEATGPAEIARAKAEIVTAETYAKQLGLSKEIQQDAQEMVRRAEYSLGKAIRKGQAEGTVRTVGQTSVRYGGREGQPRGRYDRDVQHTDNSMASPTDFATMNELSGPNGNGIYAMADNATDEEFEAAVTAAKDEGNLSRANVVRKVKQQSGPVTRQQRADLILELANQGYSSRQMPAKVGVSEERVRQIARDFDISIPADKSVGRTRRINSSQVVENTATALEGLVMGVELIDYTAVDPETASQWVDSLTESMRALNRFVRLIKEQTHD